MSTLRRLTTFISGLAVAGYCLWATSAAYAMPAPTNDWPVAAPASTAPPVTRTIEVGSPLWTYVVVAVAAGALTLATHHVIVHARRVSHPPRQAHA